MKVPCRVWFSGFNCCKIFKIKIQKTFEIIWKICGLLVLDKNSERYFAFNIFDTTIYKFQNGIWVLQRFIVSKQQCVDYFCSQKHYPLFMISFCLIFKNILLIYYLTKSTANMMIFQWASLGWGKLCFNLMQQIYL